MITNPTAIWRFACAVSGAVLATAILSAAPPNKNASPRDTPSQHAPTAIDDLPGWSDWKPVTSAGKIEFRSRLFNANVKPGCGIEFRATTPHTGYTVDAVIARSEADVDAQANDTREMLGIPVKGAFFGEYAHGSTPLHFVLFPDSLPISYFDLHWADCNAMRVFVRSIENYREGK